MQRFVRPISSPMSSLHLIKEFLLDRIGVTQCASQRMSIDLRVKREIKSDVRRRAPSSGGCPSGESLQTQGKLTGVRFQIKLDRFSDICKRLLAGFTL